MNKLKNIKVIEILVTALLALALIIFIFAAKHKQQKPNTAATMQAVYNIPPDQTQSVKAPDLKWGRDPFGAIEIAEAPSSIKSEQIRLEGIVWDAKSPKAVIGGQIYEVGSKIGNKVITRITKDRVYVSDGSREYPIKVW